MPDRERRLDERVVLDRDVLAPGGLFAFVFPTLQTDRALRALGDAKLALIRRRDIVFKLGEPPLITRVTCHWPFVFFHTITNLNVPQSSLPFSMWQKRCAPISSAP